MKQTSWVVMMPKGWKPGTCVCDKCFGNCVRTDKCPMDNAKRAVEVKPGQVQLFPCLGATSVYLDPEGIPVTLYAVEMEGK